MATRVAHDFNNLLTGIPGEASLARLECDSPRPNVWRSIEKIESLALRAAELTRQLLASSGKGRFVVLPLDLSEVVEDMASMLSVVVTKRGIKGDRNVCLLFRSLQPRLWRSLRRIAISTGGEWA